MPLTMCIFQIIIPIKFVRYALEFVKFVRFESTLKSQKLTAKTQRRKE